MYELPIERGKIREFALATCSTTAAYVTSDRPPIPPTFLTTGCLAWMPPEDDLRPQIGFDPARSLHAADDYIFHGPPPAAGDVLQASTRFGPRFERLGRRGGRLRFATIITEFRGRDGHVVAEHHMTFVETERIPLEERDG